MNMKKLFKIAATAFAGFAFGVWTTAYQTARRDDVKAAGEEFADAWDGFKSAVKGESTTSTEEVAEAAEEVAEAVEEAVSEVVPDITVTTSEESDNQPED
jgi:hypothetical protein